MHGMEINAKHCNGNFSNRFVTPCDVGQENFYFSENQWESIKKGVGPKATGTKSGLGRRDKLFYFILFHILRGILSDDPYF